MTPNADIIPTIAWARQQKTGNATQKVVLLAVATAVDVDGDDCPSQSDLAAQTGLGVRTVRRALAELERGGLLIRQRRTADGGGRRPDRITLNLDRHSTNGGRS